MGRLPVVLRTVLWPGGTMPQLEGLKEESVYLRLWLGITAVAEISLIGWFASALETATSWLLSLAVVGIMLLALSILASSPDRAPDRGYSEPVGMDIVLGVIIVAVALLFLGIAVDLTRRK